MEKSGTVGSDATLSELQIFYFTFVENYIRVYPYFKEFSL